MYNPHDTICAIATPPGESALAIVRISGKSSVNIVEKMFKSISLKDRKAEYGNVINKCGETIDEVVVVYFKGPRSYTAEDMIEISCHGGYVASHQILSIMQEYGARLAEPGEFTVRAFLNGRINLTEAEAVHSVISAKTEKSKSLALNNLEGRLSGKLDKISSMLLGLITILEAEIDFGDEEVAKLNNDEVLKRLEAISTQIEDVISTYDIGRLAEGRAQVAIVGAPNVGKSSLFNAILKSTRAIVTDKPGTTRDYLSEYVNIDGYPVILTDTAGIRESSEDVEKIGISRSLGLISEADLCLYILDGSRDLSDEDKQIYNQLQNKRVITAINKIDLISKRDLQKYANNTGGKTVHISATTGSGIAELLGLVRSYLINSSTNLSDGVLLSQRQFSHANAAKEALQRAKSIIQGGEFEEVYVGEIREALDQISIITGKITNEDILNIIFSKFCIGK